MAVNNSLKPVIIHVAFVRKVQRSNSVEPSRTDSEEPSGTITRTASLRIIKNPIYKSHQNVGQESTVFRTFYDEARSIMNVCNMAHPKYGIAHLTIESLPNVQGSDSKQSESEDDIQVGFITTIDSIEMLINKAIETNLKHGEPVKQFVQNFFTREQDGFCPLNKKHIKESKEAEAKLPAMGVVQIGNLFDQFVYDKLTDKVTDKAFDKVYSVSEGYLKDQTEFIKKIVSEWLKDETNTTDEFRDQLLHHSKPKEHPTDNLHDKLTSKQLYKCLNSVNRKSRAWLTELLKTVAEKHRACLVDRNMPVTIDLVAKIIGQLLQKDDLNNIMAAERYNKALDDIIKTHEQKFEVTLMINNTIFHMENQNIMDTIGQLEEHSDEELFLVCEDEGLKMCYSLDDQGKKKILNSYRDDDGWTIWLKDTNKRFVVRVKDRDSLNLLVRMFSVIKVLLSQGTADQNAKSLCQPPYTFDKLRLIAIKDLSNKKNVRLLREGEEEEIQATSACRNYLQNIWLEATKAANEGGKMSVDYYLLFTMRRFLLYAARLIVESIKEVGLLLPE